MAHGEIRKDLDIADIVVPRTPTAPRAARSFVDVQDQTTPTPDIDGFRKTFNDRCGAFVVCYTSKNSSDSRGFYDHLDY